MITTTKTSADRTPAMDWVLLLYLGVAFSGLTFGYIPTRKFDLSYLDALVAFVGMLSAIQSASKVRQLASVIPFVIWAVVFYVWGWLVVADQDLVTDLALNRSLVVILLGATMAFWLDSRPKMSLLADVIQIAAIINCIVCIAQASDLRFVELTIRPELTPTNADLAYVSYRPIGLWANANAAARYFVVSFILSFWARPATAWIGRVACIAGTFFTASRFGASALATVILVSTIYFLVVGGRARQTLRALTIGMILLVLTATAGSFASQSVTDVPNKGFETASAGATRWGRITDIEDAYAAQATSHQTLTMQAFDRALEAPWYGTGLSTFQQGEDGMLSGAHNLYIMVWGETGIWGLVFFPCVLLFGIAQLFRPMPPQDRLFCGLLWAVWLAAGFASHSDLNQPTSLVIWMVLFTAAPALSHATAGTRSKATVQAAWAHSIHPPLRT